MMNRVVVFALLYVTATAASVSGAITHDTYLNVAVGQNQKVSFAGGSSSGGGPFTGTLWSSSNVALDTWDSFCVEADGAGEWITLGAKYNVLSTGSDTATSTGNFITNEAKWLYYQYGHNTNAFNVGGYIWAETDAARSALQQAIWHGVLKNGPNGAPLGYSYDANHNLVRDPNSIGYNAQAAAWYNAAHLAVLANPIGPWVDSVRIINPGSDALHQNQSQLYEVVPEPASIAVWGALGAAGAAAAIRSRKRRGWSAENRQAIYDVINRA